MSDERLSGLNHYEQRVLKVIDDLELEGQSVLLAVSGGRDSMVLLTLFRQLAGRRNLKLFVGHVHHGGVSESRNQAREFVQRACKDEVFLKHNVLDEEIADEASLRELRYSLLEKWKKENNCSVIALGHYADDQLETRLLRLIRGTGREGLRAMSEVSGDRFRPLLSWSQADMDSYVALRNVAFLEDPSNKDPKYLRNWLRHIWLEELEKRCPGGRNRLAESLQTVIDQGADSTMPLEPTEERWISRQSFTELSEVSKTECLARYFRQHGVTHFTGNQLREIAKRLRSEQKEFEFFVAGHRWCVMKEQFGLKSLSS